MVFCVFANSAKALHNQGKMCMFTNGRILEDTTAIITNQDRESYALTKWFLAPTRDGTGSFYIQSAADKLKYLHCTNSSGGEGNTVEYYYFHPQLEQNSYKWKFERVSIPAPLTSGVIRFRAVPFKCIQPIMQGVQERHWNLVNIKVVELICGI